MQVAEERGVALTDLTYEDLKTLHPMFEPDVTKASLFKAQCTSLANHKQVWDFEASVESRDTPGGTSKSSVLAQIAQLQEWLSVIHRQLKL